METLMGGDAIAKMLADEGVEKVFGIIDGTYFGLYANFEKHGIEFISPRHETCAVHMAGAYSRITGKLGVCMASNGPGVANALPGIAVENTEGNRVLFLSSSRRTGIGYPDRGGTYQYFDQTGVTKPMSKWSGTASSYERIPETMKRAFRKSWQGRPGVVHVDIPESILNNPGEVTMPRMNSYRRTTPLSPDATLVKEAADLLIGAEQPLIHVGSGIIHSQAFDELQESANLLLAPITTSWAGRGAMLEDLDTAIPLSAGELQTTVRNEADVVLTLGSRIGETDWWGKAPYWRKTTEQKHIQVDLDEDIIGLNKPVDLGIFSCARLFLSALNDELKARQYAAPASRQEALTRYRALRKTELDEIGLVIAYEGAPLTAAHVTRECQSAYPKDAIVVVDGGNTAVWGNLFHEVTVPGSILGTAKMGMLGAGVAQAIGAKSAAPEREVYCIIGDGAFGFHPQEVETSIRTGLAVTYLVCVDNQWGMVKINQRMALQMMLNRSIEDEEQINTDLHPIRYDKMAEAMGAHGEHVDTVDGLAGAIERSRNSGKCAVIHIDVEPMQHLLAPNLLKFKEMHSEPAGE